MYLTDLKNFDESLETISVYALVSMEWIDQRWHQAQLQKVTSACQAGCTVEEETRGKQWAEDFVSSAVFGQTADAFFESTNGFGNGLGFIMAGNVWTPIPAHLLLKTADNPLGKTEFDPLIRMVDPVDGMMESMWVDRSQISFDVTLSYEHFPFDQQVLDLCLPFDYWSDPTFVKWNQLDQRSDVPRDIANVSVRWDRDSALSDLASERFVLELENKGFSVTSIEAVEHEDSVIGSSLCLEIKLQRRILILILRFFFPLFALLFIPFAGFFIPIEMVMPRVTTGFISFLSLQVFRQMAYSLIPKQSSSLLWMDVTMFSVTVIMFASVLENVLAQAMRANVSNMSARFVDNFSRVTFPVIGLCLLTVLFVMGGLNVDTTVTMVVCLCILIAWLAIFALAVILYVRRLPVTLMQTLVRRISHADFRYMNAIPLDHMELSTVFKSMDVDGSGNVTANEVLESFESFGLSFDNEEDETNFKTRLRTMFQERGNNNRLDLNAFCHHFGELFRFYSEEDDLIEEEKAALRKSIRQRRSQMGAIQSPRESEVSGESRESAKSPTTSFGDAPAKSSPSGPSRPNSRTSARKRPQAKVATRKANTPPRPSSSPKTPEPRSAASPSVAVAELFLEVFLELHGKGEGQEMRLEMQICEMPSRSPLRALRVTNKQGSVGTVVLEIHRLRRAELCMALVKDTHDSDRPRLGWDQSEDLSILSPDGQRSSDVLSALRVPVSQLLAACAAGASLEWEADRVRCLVVRGSLLRAGKAVEYIPGQPTVAKSPEPVWVT
eukprot:symbB.v1.2.003851.t1/scaffold213.1/size264521/6